MKPNLPHISDTRDMAAWERNGPKSGRPAALTRPAPPYKIGGAPMWFLVDLLKAWGIDPRAFEP